MKNVDRQLMRTLFITGCGRSGTSLFARLFSTAKGTSLSFDSPFLHSFFANFGSFDSAVEDQLIKKFLISSFHVDFFSGRNININSSSLTYSEGLVDRDNFHAIKNSTLSRNEIINSQRRVVVKVTDVINLEEICIRLKLIENPVIIVRDLFDVVNSILKKSWFDDLNLMLVNDDHTIPFATNEINDFLYPHWMNKQQYHEWKHMNKLERSIFYVLYISRKNLSYAKSNKISPFYVHYNKLINDPSGYTNFLFKHYKLEKTLTTQKIIKTVYPSSKSSSKQFLKHSCSKKLFDEIDCVNNMLLTL